MAKKPKKSEQDAGSGPEGSEAAGQSSGKKKKLIIGVIALVLVASGGGGWYFFKKKSAAGEGQADNAAPPPKKTAFVEVKEMVVNLGGQNIQQTGERPRYLKLRVALEVDPKVVNDVQAVLPRVEDSFQVFLRELRVSDLDGSMGVYRLKEELLKRVNLAVYPTRIDALLFKELLIQ